jgi:hypothetical protein
MLNTADQTSAADNTTKVDHDIIIALEHGNALPPNPLPELHFGQTVRYRSPAGKVRIVFPGQSPFRTADNQPMREVQDSQIVTLVTEGTFTCQCFITPHTPPNAKEVGWDLRHRESGGVHKVSKP